jgi:hypothetical protein
MRRATFLLLLTVLLLGVVAPVAGCSKKPPPEPASTSADEATFHITLPGGWTEKKTGADVTFASAARRETVTVSNVSVPGEDPRAVLDQLIELRRSSIQRAGGSPVLTRPQYEETQGTLRARFAATDAAAGTYTSFLFVATKVEALTVVFYEYGKPDPAEAASRADAVFAAFSLK